MFRNTLVVLAMLLITVPVVALGPVADHGGEPLSSPDPADVVVDHGEAAALIAIFSWTVAHDFLLGVMVR